MKFAHTPVLLQETMELLNIKPDGIYIDCTLGGGGHSIEILKRLGKNGRLIGIDRDPEAIKAASERLTGFYNFTSVHANYAEIIKVLEELKVEKADGILMDLGVSSFQLDKTSRGFTYHEEALLDMRMDTTQSFSAYDVINNYTREELTRIIRQYGEEKWAKRIAEFIVKNRPVETTTQLVDIIKKAVPAAARKGGPHPARRTFQAVRIEVNQELELLQQSIMDSVDCLKSGGRLCIISFHSLEDRIVKNVFQQLYKPCKCPKEFPVCVCGLKQRIDIVTKKPVTPKVDETEKNPRARSAKLRVCEKL